MKTWRIQVLFLLDEAERNPTAGRVKLSEIAKQCGVSRWTLWRDAEVRARYQEIVELRQKDGDGKKRRGQDQRLRILTLENENLKRHNEALLQNFIVISRRLAERGIDPVSVLGKVAPSATCDAWKGQILDWEDQ